MNGLKQLIAGATMATVIALPATAGCNRLDVVGQWSMYFGLVKSEWVSCDVGIWFDGASNGTCESFGGSVSSFESGLFSINKECDISGVINVGGDREFQVQFGHMDALKSYVHGVGIAIPAQNAEPTPFMFSAVKK